MKKIQIFSVEIPVFLLTFLITISLIIIWLLVKPSKGYKYKFRAFPDVTPGQLPDAVGAKSNQCTEHIIACNTDSECADKCGTDKGVLECVSIGKNELVQVKGKNLKEGKWCLPAGKGGGGGGCNPYAGRAIWAENTDKEDKIVNQGWSCECLWPELFTGTNCDINISCKDLTPTFSGVDQSRNVLSDINHNIFDPTSPDYVPDGRGPYDLDNDGKPIFSCKCDLTGRQPVKSVEGSTVTTPNAQLYKYNRLDMDNYSCHLEPCTDDHIAMAYDEDRKCCNCSNGSRPVWSEEKEHCTDHSCNCYYSSTRGKWNSNVPELGSDKGQCDCQMHYVHGPVVPKKTDTTIKAGAGGGVEVGGAGTGGVVDGCVNTNCGTNYNIENYILQDKTDDDSDEPEKLKPATTPKGVEKQCYEINYPTQKISGTVPPNSSSQNLSLASSSVLKTDRPTSTYSKSGYRVDPLIQGVTPNFVDGRDNNATFSHKNCNTCNYHRGDPPKGNWRDSCDWLGLDPESVDSDAEMKKLYTGEDGKIHTAGNVSLAGMLGGSFCFNPCDQGDDMLKDHHCKYSIQCGGTAERDGSLDRGNDIIDKVKANQTLCECSAANPPDGYVYYGPKCEFQCAVPNRFVAPEMACCPGTADRCDANNPQWFGTWTYGKSYCQDVGCNSWGAFWNSLKKSFGFLSCFLEGTLITMSDGSEKKIEDISEGDNIFSYGGDISTLGEQVAQDFGGGIIYGINDDEPFFTPGHCFMTTDGWKAIKPKHSIKENILCNPGKLQVGDIVFSLRIIDGEKMYSMIPIKKFTQKIFRKPIRTYGLYLNGKHNSYHANKYVVIMNHPKFTIKYIKKSMKTMSKQEKRRLIKCIVEHKTEFNKLFSEEIVDRIAPLFFEGEKK